MRLRVMLIATLCLFLGLSLAGAGLTLVRTNEAPAPAGGAPTPEGPAPGTTAQPPEGANPIPYPKPAGTPATAARVAVLMYHHLDPTPTNPYIITAERLEHDLRWFLNNGWAPLSLQQFRDWMAGDLTLLSDAFLLTFDDGYQSFATQALPVLERLGVPATVFLITDDLGPTPASAGAPKLLPSEIVELARSPLVTFGSHTHDLHYEVGPLEKLQPAVFAATEEEVRADLDASAARLEQLGITPLALAWPYGKAPEQAVRTAAEQFPLIFTGDEGWVERGQPTAIRRYPMEFRTVENLIGLFGAKAAR